MRFSGRSFSCHVSDLNLTFVTRFGPNGAEPVREAAPGEPPPMSGSRPRARWCWSWPAMSGLPRAWLAGRVKVQAGLRDLLGCASCSERPAAPTARPRRGRSRNAAAKQIRLAAFAAARSRAA